MFHNTVAQYLSVFPEVCFVSRYTLSDKSIDCKVVYVDEHCFFVECDDQQVCGPITIGNNGSKGVWKSKKLSTPVQRTIPKHIASVFHGDCVLTTRLTIGEMMNILASQ